LTRTLAPPSASLSHLDRHALRRLIEERVRNSRPHVNGLNALPAGLAGPIDAQLREHFPVTPAAAAVLVPVVDHQNGLTVLLTRRSANLRTHAGQISFPGGRVEATDAGPLEAALRETEEEIGLAREHVTFAGYLEPHLVLSGFWVTPVVGFVRPGFDLKLDPREVDSVFEVPLEHILDLTNHRSRLRMIGETSVQVYDIPFGEHNIWGATAGILVALCRLLLSPMSPMDETPTEATPSEEN
jgi:8-oxo-dGTP pyrophosphatase MutT (NUDIX family)